MRAFPLPLGSRNPTRLSYCDSRLTQPQLKSKSELLYRQSVRLGVKTLETHYQRFFLSPQLNSCVNSPYVTSSLTRRWVCRLIHKSSVSTGFTEQIMPMLRILCYNGTVVTGTVVSLTTSKFKPLVVSTSGFTLFYTEIMFTLIICYFYSVKTQQPLSYIFTSVLHVSARLSHLQVHISVY
jgi:hypothetical protein